MVETEALHLTFSKGQRVEVSINEEGFNGAWYTATIITPLQPQDPKSKNQNFFVEYHNLMEVDNETPLREQVDFAHIRPSPPKEEDPTFGIHEEVDVFWNDGWWKGEIVEVFKDDMFVVYFSNSNESTEFDRRDLRVHLEWINGRWLLPEEVRRMKQLQQQKKKNLKPQNVEGVDQLTIVSKRKGRPPKVKAMSIIPSKNGKEFLDLKACVAEKVSHVPSEEHLKIEREQRKLVNDPLTHKKLMSCIMKPPTKKRRRRVTVEQIERLSPKRGRQKATSEKAKTSTKGFEEKSSGGEAGDGDIKTERELKDAGKAMKRLSWNIINKDDQPLSTLFKEHSSQSQASSNHKMVGQTNKGITIEDEFPHETRYEISFDVNEPVFSLANVVPVEKIVKKERSKKNEVNEQSAVAEPSLHELPAVCDPIRFEIPLEYEKLSFCKNSVMWETVESWEAFCKMPQNPHFRPLEMSNAKAREGDALGHMVTFSNLAEATCKFQMDDPISDFEETLKALTELESHGFDVQKIRDKLELLMKYKTRRVALKGTSKMVKQKITEINTEYGKYNVEIGEMDKSIREMQESIAKLIEKRESIVANMQKDGSKAMELQKEVDELEESIQDLEHDFYKVVSSSW